MEEFKVLDTTMYDLPKKAISMWSGDEVEIIGEQTARYGDKLLEQYIYNIVGYTPANGKPFISLKSNLVLV